MRLWTYRTEFILYTIVTSALGGAERKALGALATPHDVAMLCLWDAPAIADKTAAVITEATEAVAAIIAIPHEGRTFVNTMRAFDHLETRSDFAIFRNLVGLLELVHPDQSVRDAAHTATIHLGRFSIDKLGNNQELYHAFCEYQQLKAHQEPLSAEERYYLSEVLANYQRRGLDRDEVVRSQITALEKEIQQLGLEFERNITEDATPLQFTRDELAGVDDEFIATLDRTDAGHYILLPDAHPYAVIIDTCTVAATRKALYLAYSNRGNYSSLGERRNLEILQRIIACRDRLAHLLNYSSTAQLALQGTMAEHPERAELFLRQLLVPVHAKVEEEYAQFTADLPPSVILRQGRLEHWDVAFVKTIYKKKHLMLDEDLIAEYFPMDLVIERIFELYHEFLGVSFHEVSGVPLWHEDARLFELSRGDEQLGYLILDLHPRPNKYSHACEYTLVHQLKGAPCVSSDRTLSVVIANFPRATPEKPALWNRAFAVKTFLHELGHALHEQLGRTELGSFCGTNVKLDFVEMPSQMIEEWLDEPEVLKRLSSHYRTGEPLPDTLIARIQGAKHIDAGFQLQRQIMLARFALACYDAGAEKNPHEIMYQLQAKIMHRVVTDPDYAIYASFGHMTGYGARYYGYLWSQVFALDLFAEIKKQGLFNPRIGARYVDTILSKGGSSHPATLLRDFLGREPNQQAFMERMGLVIHQSTIET